MNMKTNRHVIRLDKDDNVCIARAHIPGGTAIEDGAFVIAADISAGHKIASKFLPAGTPIVKGGHIIGQASRDIAQGAPVHIDDLVAASITRKAKSKSVQPAINAAQRATFQGYVQPDGRIGTRNFIGVFIVSNCAATAARQVVDFFDESLLSNYPNIDGVIPFVHELGCGMEMTGEPMDLLRRTISGYIRNPNVYGAVVLALGCERNNLGVFLAQEKLEVGDRLQTVTIQEAGGIKNTVEIARKYVEAMLPEANKVVRQTVSAEHLVVGVQSSAADGFTGITANPVIGAAMDLVVQNGGTVILSETPEIAFAADELASRAATPEIGAQLQQRIAWWTDYSRGRDAVLNRLHPNAVSSGISSTVERAYDAISKAGTSTLNGVFAYGKQIKPSRGLVFMDSPDYDPVSVTGQIASGATLIAMSTGGASSFGSLPAPTLKLASNSETYRRYAPDIDIDCGPILDGDDTIEDLGRRTFEMLLETASGKHTKSEYEGMGENEFVPWHIGVLA